MAGAALDHDDLRGRFGTAAQIDTGLVERVLGHTADHPAVGLEFVAGLLGIQPEDLGIDVTLVPIYHDLGDDCPETPAPTENDVALLSEWLLAHNPADHVDITIAPALTFSQTVSNGFDLLLNFLAQARDLF